MSLLMCVTTDTAPAGVALSPRLSERFPRATKPGVSRSTDASQRSRKTRLQRAESYHKGAAERFARVGLSGLDGPLRAPNGRASRVDLSEDRLVAVGAAGSAPRRPVRPTSRGGVAGACPC